MSASKERPQCELALAAFCLEPWLYPGEEAFPLDAFNRYEGKFKKKEKTEKRKKRKEGVRRNEKKRRKEKRTEKMAVASG